MRYEEFKQLMIEKLSSAVPFETTVSVKTVRKNNGIVLDAVNILEPGECITPTFYLLHYYEKYVRGIPADELVHEILYDRRRFARTGIRTGDILTRESVRRGVRFKVVNYDMNAVQLREIPHKRILDLAMVYYLKVDESILPDARILLRREHLHGLGIEEEELKVLAEENTERSQPLSLESLYTRLSAFRGNREEAEKTDPCEMYVLTNMDGIFGAGTLFYKGTAEYLRSRFPEDLFLLPSSVHEWILLPDRHNMQIRELNDLICQINEAVVEDDEILSSHAYVFEREHMHLGFMSY